MSLSGVKWMKEALKRGARAENGSLQAPLLRHSSVKKTDEFVAPVANAAPDTQKMSLDEWVASERRTCAHSRAAEAARRIKVVQQGKITTLDLYRCHLHSVPPLVGCQHVTYYRLTANYLMRAPEDLGELPNLRSLSLASNGLREVPQLSRYKTLITLEVGGNPISHLPSALRNRRICIGTPETLLSEWQRKQYRSGQRRLRLQASLLRCFSWLPKWCLPRLTEDMPTFDGGNACEQGSRPFAFPQRCPSSVFSDK